MGSFWPKYILFELKKYREVILHDTEEWCSKILRKADMQFGKWQEESGKFSQEHWKVSKLYGIWWDPFIQSRKCMNWKFTEVMSWQWRIMQNFERNWLSVSKLTWGILNKFWPEHSSCKNLHFNGLFLTKVYNVWAKKVQRSYVW